MTREEARKAAEVMLAYAEGREIEFRNKRAESWESTLRPIFNWECNDYRIKPQPTYRPFKDAEECWQEMQKHQPFGWVKDNVIVRNIMGVQNNGIWLPVRGDDFSYDEMLKDFTFADGEPFGVKEEE